MPVFNKKLTSFFENKDNKVEQFHSKLWNIAWKILDDIFINTQSVYRPLRGHAFETWFRKLLTANGYTASPGFGDDIVDMRVNGFTLQLKTPYWRGTKNGALLAP